MSIAQRLLPEFKHEMQNTKKILERTPGDKLLWTPHPKSMPFGKLAMHVAIIPGWAENTIRDESMDVEPVGGPKYVIPIAESKEQIMETFGTNVIAAYDAIASAGDETLLKDWSLLFGGKVVFTMPRIAVLRAFVISHIIHHRAQLGMYLRLNDLPVPAIYGPSGDEAS